MSLSEKIQHLTWKRTELFKQKDEFGDELKMQKREIINCENARAVLQAVAEQTQNEVSISISDIVTNAMQTVMNEPYEFKVQFIQKRGKTEAELKFVRDGLEIDPIASSGGGAVDLAAFALRVSLWCLSKPANTIVLDEPFRFLSKGLQPKAGELLKEISSKLGIQFIIVTHEKALVDSANKVIKVTKKNSVSEISDYII